MYRGVSFVTALFLLLSLFSSCTTEVEPKEQEAINIENNENQSEPIEEKSSQTEIENSTETESTDNEEDNGEKIEPISGIKPGPQDLTWVFKSLYGTEFPEYEGKYTDLRSADLTDFNLEDKSEQLLNSNFDTITKWPDSLPEGFDPYEIMELNKNPGLHIRELHEKGITGEGIGVGIIDYALIVNHEEYKDNLKLYEHIHHPDNRAHFHGPMVTSIIGGKNIGVAPKADLYFIASQNYDYNENEKRLELNASYPAQSIRRILEVNESLPKENKIRVISYSGGYSPSHKGYEEFKEAVNEAKEQGIFVISCNLFEYNEKFHFRGLKKNPLNDPDENSSYTMYPWNEWIRLIAHANGEYYASEYEKITEKKILLIPMESLTTADATGPSGYEFRKNGGWSSAIPYIAGLYALSCQVKPDITPEEFWDIAYETGITKEIEEEGIHYEGKMVNPVRLIDTLLQDN